LTTLGEIIMKRIKKSWWLFSVLCIITSYLNPYYTVFISVNIFFLICDASTIYAAKTYYRQQKGLQVKGRIRYSKGNMRGSIIGSTMFLAIYLFICFYIPMRPDIVVEAPVWIGDFSLNTYMIIILALSITFYVISYILFALRIYDLCWNKNHEEYIREK